MAFKDKQRVNLFLDPNIVKRAKVEALNQGTSLSTIIEKSLEQTLPIKVQVRFAGEIDEQVKKLKGIYKNFK